MEDNIINNSLASISLTHVQYNHQDKIGKLLAYLTLTPLAVLVAYVAIIASRREFATGFMFLGQLLNEGLNFTLKRIIKENRPTSFLGKGYGMPSSHAMFVAYTTVYCLIYLWFRLKIKRNIFRFVMSVGLIIWTGLVCYSRFYLRYHTGKQVLIGSIIGSIFAFGWDYFVERIIRQSEAFKSFKESSFCKFFYIKDSRNIPNVWAFEYENINNSNKSKKLK